MRQLLNTLFVTSEDEYLSLEGENVLANKAQQVVARYPHTANDRQLFLFRGIASSDGSVRSAGHRSCVLYAQGTISGASLRRKQRECSAAAGAIPGRR